MLISLDCADITWAAPSEFGTYRLCEQRRFRRACASVQSRQNLRCSLIQAVSQEKPSDRKPDPWPVWMAGRAQLKFVMTECLKTQIRLTRPTWYRNTYLILALGCLRILPLHDVALDDVEQKTVIRFCRIWLLRYKNAFFKVTTTANDTKYLKLYNKRVIALISVNIAPHWYIYGCSQACVLQYPNWDNIHWYQCNNPIILHRKDGRRKNIFYKCACKHGVGISQSWLYFFCFWPYHEQLYFHVLFIFEVWCKVQQWQYLLCIFELTSLSTSAETLSNLLFAWNHIGAAAWENQQNYLCAERRLRSVWASTQTDQSLCC